MELYTIGHSNQSLQSFVDLLQQYDVEVFVDVRTDPRSPLFPHFNETALRKSLPEYGIGYVHIPKLGGLRMHDWHVDRHINEGWGNPSFKNYADWTLHLPYEQGLTQLLSLAAERRVAYGCCEEDPRNCHRTLVSNTLVARGHNVYHIRRRGRLEPHRLGTWGATPKVEDGLVTYPATGPLQMVLPL